MKQPQNTTGDGPSDPEMTLQHDQALLQQAPVQPLDASGFTASIVGTALFAIAWLIASLRQVTGLWLWVLGIGTLLGLLLIGFTAWHKNAHRPDRGSDSSALAELSPDRN
ncbi:MAG: hypothetical protein LBV30_07855 [Propionibacteriaceae bacterium]|nr:hypothetical protein [Propionibacteriaceae bacterium]